MDNINFVKIVTKIISLIFISLLYAFQLILLVTLSILSVALKE